MPDAQKTALYRTWYAMKARCNDPRHHAFYRYGGRGIDVCEAWASDFTAFARDMGPRPPNTSIDRIDNSRGYSPDNCRWTDAKTQVRNSRTSKVSEQDVRDLLRMVHVDGAEVHTLDLVFPLSVVQIRAIALGRSFPIEGYVYPTKLPRRSDAKQYRGGSLPKLNAEKVIEIRRRYAEGEDVKSIALDYDTSLSNVYNVGRGHTWRVLK